VPAGESANTLSVLRGKPWCAAVGVGARCF